MHVAWWLTATFAVSLLSGCIGGEDLQASLPGAVGDGVKVPQEVVEWVPPDVAWNTNRNYSLPLEVQGLDVLPVEHVSFLASDGIRIDTSVWRPKVAEGEKVPVILDVGPYYEDGIAQMGPDAREKLYFIDGFVQNGYAYGRVAIRGTSTSGGCMEFFSLREQADVDEAVTYFGTREWSNGNVALYGASYDGTTPWMAAMFGNPHLKTIVPVSGLTDIAGLMFRNGTNEVRGEIMHSVVYWPFGFDAYRPAEDHVANAACPEAYRGLAAGPWTSNTGDREGVGPTADYWAERDFRQRIKDNYEGSVYLVHGLQDWNVEPSMAYPFVNELEAQGIEVKHMLGQWGHDWPDRASRQNSSNDVVQKSVRWDWGELLLRWFDKELKGDADAPVGAPVDVQDNYGNWRQEMSWPPRDAAWTPHYLGDGILQATPTDEGQALLYNPGRNLDRVPAVDLPADVELVSVENYEAYMGPLKEELRFSGMARLHATFVPQSPEGARLYAELVDVAPDGETRRAAHAVMDLRYYAGGQERQELVPGEPVTALIEFFGADVVVPAGHELLLRIVAGNSNDGTQEHPLAAPVELVWGDEASVLWLPQITRDVGDGKYLGQPDPPEPPEDDDEGTLPGLPLHPYGV